MINATIADDFVTLIVAVTSTATSIRNLIDALTGEYIPDGTIIQVSLTPDSDISVMDTHNNVETTIKSGTMKNFPFLNAIDRLKLKSSGSVNCIIDLYINLK